ncbi:MAG: amidohydrolase [Pseudomonadales bacterium]
MKHAILLALCLITTACGERPTGEGAPPPAGPASVDLIVSNGRVLTLDADNRIASTLVVDDGRIVAVGDASLTSAYTADTTVDLGGKTAMPGFVDSHIHINAQPGHYIELGGTRSVAEIMQLVTDKAAVVGPGNWITGYGWSEDELAEGRKPTRDDLDAAAPGHPVILTRAGGHSAVVSSAALDLAGIDATTPDPDGGIIERDDAGRLNGIIRERQEIVGELVPPTPRAELRPDLQARLQALFAKGITSIIQAQDTIDNYPEWEAVYAGARGRLPRAAVQLSYAGRDAMAAFGWKTGDGDEHLRVGAIKIFVDGGFTGPAAYTTKPYKGEDEYRGKLNMSEDELSTLIRQAHEDGWQLGIHAIGDAAIQIAVQDLVETLEASPRPDHRHYLNHFTIMPDDDTMRSMAEHGIAITQQPNFTYTLEGRYVANLDGERLETNNPLHTPMSFGIHLAISSDILPIGPTVGLYAATTRKGMSGRVFGAGEKLTALEALKAYTVKGAWLTREENEKGSLEPGRLADFVVLSADPLAMAPDDLMDLAVLETWLGGEQVYSSTDTPKEGD